MKSTMTGTVTSSGRGGTAAAMAQDEKTAEEHSILEQQPPGRFDHPAWCVLWTVQPASTLKHSEDTVREHITGTEFSPELSASLVHGRVELCTPTSWPRTRDERRR